MNTSLIVRSEISENLPQRSSIDLRLLRYFLVVSEELSFARAAQRLNIEQSPVSRAMRDLERILCVKLFDKTRRQMQLTWAGRVLKEETRCVLAKVEQAIQTTKSAARGFQEFLRLAVPDCFAQPKIATLLARCREHEPSLEIQVYEMSFKEQVQALSNDLIDIGVTLSSETGTGLVAEQLNLEALSVVLPARHPLLGCKEITLEDAIKYPLVLLDSNASGGIEIQLQSVLNSIDARCDIATRANSLGILLTLIGAGFGIGFALASQVQALDRPDIVTRPVSDNGLTICRYLVRRKGEPPESMRRFMNRVREVFE